MGPTGVTSGGATWKPRSVQAKPRTAAPVLVPVLATVVTALAAGYVLFRFIEFAVGGLWTDIPAQVFAGRVPLYYVVGIPVVAGLLVAWSRSVGADGHNPLYGFSRDPVAPRAFPTTLANIVITLAGGLVLGPEMALVATGSVIGGSIARRAGSDVGRGSGLGSLAALAALAVDPIRTGHLSFGVGYSHAGSDVLLAVGAAVIATVIIAAVRAGAFGLMRLRGGDRPIAWQLAVGGLVVGAAAATYQLTTNQPVSLVLTSGEQLIRPMVGLGSVGLILTTVAIKAICYLISMGAGFRGGPYFPVMFIGAGVGAMIGLLTTGSVQAPALAGLLATTVFLAKPPWLAVLALGLVVGFAFGGAAMLPVALIGAAVGKLVPRVFEPTAPAAPAAPGDGASAAVGT